MTAFAASLGPSTYWYLSRATGAVALLLLTVSVVLGVLGPLRVSAPRWPRFAIDLVHRDVSLLVVVLMVLHIATSVLDGFAPIAWLDGLIPFASAYRPIWMGLGTFAFDLILALVITSLLRVRMGYRVWRGVHWLAYLSWPVAVLHGLGTGSDVKTWWMLLLTVACLAAVVAAVLVRIARTQPMPANIRTSATLLAIGTPVGLAVFALAGPFAAGWSRRAGTPARLLGAASATAAPAQAPVTAGTSSGPLDKPFTASLNGTVSQNQQGSGVVIELSLQLRGGLDGRMRVRLGGAPLAGGGLSLTGSQVDLSAVGMRSALDGKVTSLSGGRFLAQVADSTGLRVKLQASVSIDSSNNTVTGNVAGTPESG